MVNPNLNGFIKTKNQLQLFDFYISFSALLSKTILSVFINKLSYKNKFFMSSFGDTKKYLVLKFKVSKLYYQSYKKLLRLKKVAKVKCVLDALSRIVKF